MSRAAVTRIYLDHHATTPLDPRVLSAMLPFFDERFGNANARMNARGREAARTLEAARAQIGALAAASPESVRLTSGASAANRDVFALLSRAPGDRDEVCVSALEHPSVTEAASASGLRVRTIPASAAGFITPEALRAVCGPRTALVSVLAASHEVGTLQPIDALAETAHEQGARFHCDATQAAGKVPVFWGSADVVTLSAHKLYGPQGIGALVVRYPAALAPHSGTPPLALAVGFGAACALASASIETEGARLRARADGFLAALGPHVLNGAPSPRLPGSLNLRFGGCDAEEILLACSDELELSTGAACASARRTPSPVLRAMGLSDVEIASSVRVSFGRFNTEDEATRAGEILRRVTGAQSDPSRH